MKSRRMVVSGLMLFTMMGGLALAGSAPTSLAAAPAMLAEFTWTGAAGDDLLLSHCNWHPGETCSFTDPVPGAGDNATFPTNGGTAWAVDVETVMIDDLTLNEDVNFGAVSGAPTLTVDNKLVINGGSASVTIIKISEGAAILVP
ncbi:MAG: hypothetical protein IID33_09435 [Planctomycetes bacterium]|nr:hypothetical protein [Planctomycetota bacterium]